MKRVHGEGQNDRTPTQNVLKCVKLPQIDTKEKLRDSFPICAQVSHYMPPPNKLLMTSVDVDFSFASHASHCSVPHIFTATLAQQA